MAEEPGLSALRYVLRSVIYPFCGIFFEFFFLTHRVLTAWFYYNYYHRSTNGCLGMYNKILCRSVYNTS